VNGCVIVIAEVHLGNVDMQELAERVAALAVKVGSLRRFL
jgi:hypothetical protein